MRFLSGKNRKFSIELFVGQNSTKLSTNSEELFRLWERNLSKKCVIIGNAKKDYNITDKILGKGGFAEVFECREKSSSELFAVKVIQKNPLIEQPHKLVISSKINSLPGLVFNSPIKGVTALPFFSFFFPILIILKLTLIEISS